MNPTLVVCNGALVALFAFGPTSANEVFPVIHHQPITVRILDGRDGNPQTLAHVVLVAGYDRRDLGLGLWVEEKITDAEGTVQLSEMQRNLPFLRVEVLKHRLCQPDSAESAWSVERIRRNGLSAANRCGTITVADAPGIFTVFVKGRRGQ
jgi:hypothetical protein